MSFSNGGNDVSNEIHYNSSAHPSAVYGDLFSLVITATIDRSSKSLKICELYKNNNIFNITEGSSKSHEQWNLLIKTNLGFLTETRVRSFRSFRTGRMINDRKRTKGPEENVRVLNDGNKSPCIEMCGAVWAWTRTVIVFSFIITLAFQTVKLTRQPLPAPRPTHWAGGTYEKTRITIMCVFKPITSGLVERLPPATATNKPTTTIAIRIFLLHGVTSVMRLCALGLALFTFF